jgi:hypothetical protein
MASSAKYTSSYVGVGEMLRSDEMLEAMASKAEKIKVLAEELAHVSPVGSQLSPSGAYKKSFKIHLSKNGGRHANRAEAKVVSDDPIAIFVEHGTSKMKGDHVLLRALMEALRT